MQTLKFPIKDRTDFVGTLRSRVDQYFKDNNISKTGDYRIVIKTITMLAFTFVPYALIMTGVITNPWMMLVLAPIMGIGVAGIGMCTMHDANHGSYTSNKTINNLLGYTMDLVGSSSFTWKVQHNVLHHTYTNVHEYDEDIENKFFLRLSPHGKLLKVHRYQHIYAIFLYSLSNFSFIITKDFRQFVKYSKMNMFKRLNTTFTRELITLIVAKSFFYFYAIILPLLILDITWWQFLIGFFIVQGTAGIILTSVFQLAHVVEGPSHHEPAESGVMDDVWAVHQLNTTANFARKNPLITWFVGGLNFQVEHHLFPNISHVHYSKLAAIVEKTAKEYNVNYFCFPSFRSALRSHFRVLKRLGRGQAVNPQKLSKAA